MPYVLLVTDENARDVCSIHLGNNSKPPNHVSHVPALNYVGCCQRCHVEHWCGSAVPYLGSLFLVFAKLFLMTADPWAPVLKNETNWSGVKLNL